MGMDKDGSVFMAKPSPEGKSTGKGRRRDTHPVDENLRRVYEDMVDDHIPDRFADLLRKLREREGRQ